MATDEIRLSGVIQTLGREASPLLLEITLHARAHPPSSGYVSFTMVNFIVIFAAPWAHP
jgi:hypothetical protein